jgi:hypothetical protein
MDLQFYLWQKLMNQGMVRDSKYTILVPFNLSIMLCISWIAENVTEQKYFFLRVEFRKDMSSSTEYCVKNSSISKAVQEKQ